MKSFRDYLVNESKDDIFDTLDWLITGVNWGEGKYKRETIASAKKIKNDKNLLQKFRKYHNMIDEYSMTQAPLSALAIAVANNEDINEWLELYENVLK